MIIKLFLFYIVKDVILKNWIVMLLMCMYLCEKEDGVIIDFYMVYYIICVVG